MGVVKLGDASTWKTTEALTASAGTSSAAQAARQPSAHGTLVRLPSAPAAAPLPPPMKRTMAWPDGKISVSYPQGYDPVTRTFNASTVNGDSGAASKPHVKRTLTPAASGPEAAAEAERRRKRAARFAGASEAGGAEAAAPAGADTAEDDGTLDGYARKYAAVQAEQARLRAEFAARKRAHAPEEAPPPHKHARAGGKKHAAAAPPGRAGGVLSRLALSASAKLDLSLDELRSRR